MRSPSVSTTPTSTTWCSTRSRTAPSRASDGRSLPPRRPRLRRGGRVAGRGASSASSAVDDRVVGAASGRRPRGVRNERSAGAVRVLRVVPRSEHRCRARRSPAVAPALSRRRVERGRCVLRGARFTRGHASALNWYRAASCSSSSPAPVGHRSARVLRQHALFESGDAPPREQRGEPEHHGVQNRETHVR